MSKPIDDFRGKHNFLSNFWYSRVELDGVVYATIEHAFQAAKNPAPEVRARFHGNGPAVAKRIGRSIPLRADWEEVKLGIMHSLLLNKFQDPELRSQLLETGERELIEGNTWHDNYWGDCRCGRRGCGNGRNMLGKILMEVRSEIRSSVE